MMNNSSPKNAMVMKCSVLTLKYVWRRNTNLHCNLSQTLKLWTILSNCGAIT